MFPAGVVQIVGFPQSGDVVMVLTGLRSVAFKTCN
jgi:hypothetical protein